MKKIALFAFVVCASVAANASYLLWQVTSAEYTATEWDTAKIYLVPGDTYDDAHATLLSNVGYVSGSGYQNFAPEQTTVYPSGSFSYVANLGEVENGAHYSYYVELWNGNSKVGLSTVTTTTEIKNRPYVYSDTGDITISLANIASVTPWHAGSYGPVPEPTSGLMLLLGAAMLGLRRKNRSVA